MKKRIAVILGYLLFCTATHAHILPILSDLPVQWQSEESWNWQGQPISSQRFSSDSELTYVAQQIQQRLESMADLRVQRLSSSWLLSFEKNQIHYLILLSAQQQGSHGWLSSMSLAVTSDLSKSALPKPPLEFAGLYEHSWSLSAINSADIKPYGVLPHYFILQPVRKNKKAEQALFMRLQRYGWRNRNCNNKQFCQWHKGKKKMLVWVDSKDGLWHLLWWPVLSGDKNE